MMAAIPTIQVRLTRFAPEAPSLMGAMNLASLNVANAIGAWSANVVDYWVTHYFVLGSQIALFVNACGFRHSRHSSVHLLQKRLFQFGAA